MVKPLAVGQAGENESTQMDRAGKWVEMQEMLEERLARIQQITRGTVQKGETTEANPWLKRTGWQEYLMDLGRPDLLACVDEPDASTSPDRQGEKEEVTH